MVQTLVSLLGNNLDEAAGGGMSADAEDTHTHHDGDILTNAIFAET